jgi:transposase
MATRRISAIPDLRTAASGQDLAKKYGVSKVTISRWRGRLKRDGSLDRRFATGPRRRVGQNVVAEIYRGSQADWTARSFRDAIERRTGVAYELSYAGRILWRLRRSS